MKKIEGYHIWKIYNVYSHDDDLAIFETSNVPELEDPFFLFIHISYQI